MSVKEISIKPAVHKKDVKVVTKVSAKLRERVISLFLASFARPIEKRSGRVWPTTTQLSVSEELDDLFNKKT